MITQIIDKALLRRRLARAHRRRASGADFLMKVVAADLADRLGAVERTFSVAVVCGGQTSAVADAVIRSGKVGELYRIEPVEAAFVDPGTHGGVVGDEEALPLRAGSVDLVISALALQWTNDLPGALIQARQALRPDGLFLAALAGGGTMRELRDSLMVAETELRGGASPRVIPAVDVRDLGGLLQRAGFALPVADRDVMTVRYDTAFQLFADLKAMGATNVLVDRERTPATRELLMRTAEIYAERFSDPDGRIRATFDIVSLSGWAPHDSQQKPAPRGSATVSLQDVLGRSRP